MIGIEKWAESPSSDAELLIDQMLAPGTPIREQSPLVVLIADEQRELKGTLKTSFSTVPKQI
jgi:hypothetical protein